MLQKIKTFLSVAGGQTPTSNSLSQKKPFEHSLLLKKGGMSWEKLQLAAAPPLRYNVMEL